MEHVLVSGDGKIQRWTRRRPKNVRQVRQALQASDFATENLPDFDAGLRAGLARSDQEFKRHATATTDRRYLGMTSIHAEAAADDEPELESFNTALWLGALMLAGNAELEPVPDKLDEFAMTLFALYRPTAKA